jgi:AcrR family transcriptional regulator
MSASPDAPDGQRSRRTMRADARRNRERILDAATELFVEQGVDVPLDAIARRADVGIATLYRRFPERDALVSAVALEAFTSVHRHAEGVVGAGGGSILRRFFLGIAELRVGVLMASLLPAISELAVDAELEAAFEDMEQAIAALTAAAQAAGELREDVSADDLMLLLAMITRPLEGVPEEYTEAITPRLLHLVIEGLRPSGVSTPPPSAPPRPEPDGLHGLGAQTGRARSGPVG